MMKMYRHAVGLALFSDLLAARFAVGLASILYAYHYIGEHNIIAAAFAVVALGQCYMLLTGAFHNKTGITITLFSAMIFIANCAISHVDHSQLTGGDLAVTWLAIWIYARTGINCEPLTRRWTDNNNAHAG